MSSHTRREFIRTTVAGSVLFSGCIDRISDTGSSNGSDSGVADVLISNKMKSELTINISIIDIDESETIISKKVSIMKGEKKEFNNIIQNSGKHKIKINPQDGATDTYEWNATKGDETALHVAVNKSSISFAVAVE